MIEVLAYLLGLATLPAILGTLRLLDRIEVKKKDKGIIQEVREILGRKKESNISETSIIDDTEKKQKEVKKDE